MILWGRNVMKSFPTCSFKAMIPLCCSQLLPCMLCFWRCIFFPFRNTNHIVVILVWNCHWKNHLGRTWSLCAWLVGLQTHTYTHAHTHTCRAELVTWAMCLWISVGIWLLFPFSMSQMQRLWAWVTALRPPGHLSLASIDTIHTRSVKMSRPICRITPQTSQTQAF